MTKPDLKAIKEWLDRKRHLGNTVRAHLEAVVEYAGCLAKEIDGDNGYRERLNRFWDREQKLKAKVEGLTATLKGSLETEYKLIKAERKLSILEKALEFYARLNKIELDGFDGMMVSVEQRLAEDLDGKRAREAIAAIKGES